MTWNDVLNSYEGLVDNPVGACILPEGQVSLCHLPKPKPKSWGHPTLWLEALSRVGIH